MTKGKENTINEIVINLLSNDCNNCKRFPNCLIENTTIQDIYCIEFIRIENEIKERE